MSESMAEMITASIDGVEVSVPKGTLLIRAAEAAGIAIPRFCDHPLLDPVAACRECMVEITDAGNGRGFPKPQPSCATEAANGMVVKTQATSASAAQAQADVLEFMLINHPLDCPICDKGGECPLQNQALSEGKTESRYDGVKRQFPNPVPLSELILLNRERCVMCTRCTRFSDQISGDPLIQLAERGAKQQVAIHPDKPYNSYFSGNVVQICPVGALTSSDYRFSARPFDLVSTVTTCENCAAGCQLRVDSRHGAVRRRYAGDEPQINEEWSCDKGRFGFYSNRGDDRLTRPMVRKNGTLTPVSWPEALGAAAAGLAGAEGSVGVLTGGRLSVETAYAYSRLARTVLSTNSIDFRSRPASAEEASFLACHVSRLEPGQCVTYSDLDEAKRVVLVGFEPEDESPIIFLRLRKAQRKRGLQIVTLAPFLSPGSAKLDADLVAAAPSDLPRLIGEIEADSDTIIMVGERLAEVPGALSAIAAKIVETGARMAWVPRRAGEVGAVKVGCLPGLLPGGRPVDDETARREMLAAWGGRLADDAGLDGVSQLAAAAQGTLKALVISGMEPADYPDPELATKGLEEAFVVCMETRRSAAAELADVVLPVDLLENTSGTFLNWEHRVCPVNQVAQARSAAMPEVRVLAALAEAMGSDLGFRTIAGAAESLAALPTWEGAPAAMDTVKPEAPAGGGVVVSTWRELLDDARCLDGSESVRATARPVLARISPQTRRTEGLATSSHVRLTGPKGSITFPLRVEPTMADGVIWVPRRAKGDELSRIGVSVGGSVTLAAAPGPKKEGEE